MKYLIFLLLLIIGCSEPLPEQKEQQNQILPETVKFDLDCNCPESHSLKDYPFILGESETLFKYKEKEESRAHNIEAAVNFILNGQEFLILKPGEVFSYNKRVGMRSKESGFLDAPVIFNGEIKQDVGGGVCQVSSTIFSAAVFAGLKIIERTSHSRPSSYISKGLDATVLFPEICGQEGQICYDVDLKIKNEYEFPIIMNIEIKNKFVNGNDLKTLRVSFLSMFEGSNIKTKWVTTETSPFEKELRVIRNKIKKAVKKQNGSNGTTGYLQVDNLTNDSSIKIFSYYQPVNEIWETSENL